MTGQTFHVDLPYRWHLLDATVMECACADAKAYGIFVDTCDRGADANGDRIFRFWSQNFTALVQFRNDLCSAYGMPFSAWRKVIKSEYTSSIPFVPA